MQQEWAGYWAAGRTGFHRSEVHAMLLKHQQLLLRTPNDRTLVPLCGKSLDLSWLASNCQQVIGSEWVHQAIEAYFTEHGLTPTAHDCGEHQRYSAHNVQLFEGDFLTLDVAQTGRFEACWDRAAMIALPPDTRQQYVPHLVSLMQPNGRILLVTYDTNKPANEGPPYPVKAEEITTAYASYGKVTLIESVNYTPDTDPRLREKGLAWVREDIFLIELGS